MKGIFFIFFLISGITFSQNNHIVKTEDGRRVLLKSDFTWEYIDLEKPKVVSSPKKELKELTSNRCNLGEESKEPKLKSKIQSQLKRGKSSMPYIKKKVAKDVICNVEDVILLSFTETKERGVYYFCANGEEVKYKRIGNRIMVAKKMF